MKIKKWGQFNENNSIDYYDVFKFSGGGHRYAVEFGWVEIMLDDKTYQFYIEESDDFFNVILNSTDEEQKEIEELGIKIDLETSEIEDESFKDFIFDMYQQACGF